MKLVAYDKDELMKGIYKRTKNQKILKEFIDGEAECARIEGWTNRNATACACSFRESIKRFRVTGIHVFVRKGEVYLVKNVK